MVQRGERVTFWSRLSRRPDRPYVLWASWAAVLVTCLYAGRLHFFFWQHAGRVGFDDAYTMAVGERLIDGQWLPYVDGVSHRGPLLYWAAALAQEATGRYGWLGARVLSLVTTYGTLLGVFGVGLVARRPLAGALAAIFYAWSVLTVQAASPAFAITGEGLMSPLCVLSVLCAAQGLLRTVAARRQETWLIGAGICAALAGLAKQTALPLAAPLGLWILAHRASAPGIAFKQGALRSLAAFASGFFGTLIAVVVLYLAHGELGTFWYWYYVYNAEIYMSIFPGVTVIAAFTGFLYQQPWPIGAFFIVIGCAVVRPLGLMRPSWRGMLRGYAAVGLESTAAWIALAMFVAGVAAMRFWPHYFLGVLPFVGLVLGLQSERLLREAASRNDSARPALAFLVLIVAANAFWTDRRYTGFLGEATAGGWRVNQDAPACQVIASYSRPRDSLFVWGWYPDLYLTCRRKPASRYVFLTTVAGIVAPQWAVVRADRVAKGVRENLLGDLKHARPSVILDAPASLSGVSMLSVPWAAAYLQAKYCNRGVVNLALGGQATVWVRRDLPACASQPGNAPSSGPPASPPKP